MFRCVFAVTIGIGCLDRASKYEYDDDDDDRDSDGGEGSQVGECRDGIDNDNDGIN